MIETKKQKTKFQRPGYRNPIPTTDIIIEYCDGEKEGIVLITRKNPPYGLAIPGGFAELGLTLEENAQKEAREETNLEVELLNPGRPYVYSNPDRDPRFHMISNTYIAKGRGTLQAGDDAAKARLYSIDEVVELFGTGKIVFDHENILKEYLKCRRYKK